MPEARGSLEAEPAGARPLLDASAVLSLLKAEPGADLVADAVAAGASITIVNLAEVLSTLASAGQDPSHTLATLKHVGGIDGAIAVKPITEADAVEAARLHPLTKGVGLSLADRLCIAAAKRLGVSVLTADQDWQQAQLDINVIQIRGERRRPG